MVGKNRKRGQSKSKETQSSQQRGTAREKDKHTVEQAVGKMKGLKRSVCSSTGEDEFTHGAPRSPFRHRNLQRYLHTAA